MVKKESVQVTVTLDEIRAGLQKLIRSDHSRAITDVILGNLALSEIGLEQLYKAFNGIVPVCKFKVLDEVYVDMSVCASWQFDKEKMKDAKMIFKGHIKAQITEINIYKRQPLRLSYKYIDNSGVEQKYEHTWVEEKSVHLITSEMIEDLKEEDQLPF